MGEQNPTQVTNSVTEPTNQQPQEPTTPTTKVEQPVVEPTPKVDKPKVDGGNTNVAELLSTVDKATLLKSEVVQGLLENARQQEKNKLYKTIEDKDNTIKQLNETISDLQNQLKIKEETTMEGEKVLLEQIQALKESHEQLLKDIEKEREQARLAEVKAYRTQKIAEANGELIEALVKGNTKEEIDASIEVAKAEYQKIVAPLKEKVEELVKPNKANAPKPSNPSTPPSMEFTAEQIKAMSPSEYAKYRENLLKSIRG